MKKNSLKKFLDEKQKIKGQEKIAVQYIATPGRGIGLSVIVDDEIYDCQAVGEEVAA